MYQHLILNRGQVFINSQNPILSNMAKRFESPVYYPAASDYYHCELAKADPYLMIRTEDGDLIQTQLVGAYNFENIASALCISKFFGVEAALANRAVAAYAPGNMRSQVIRKGTNTIILDAYNANPSSMEAAIENLATMSGKKVAIVGDMYELENEAEAEHRAVGRLLAGKKLDRVYLCGNLMLAAKDELQGAFFFSDKSSLIEALKKNPMQDTTILVKASRGMGLESVVEFL